MGLTLSATALTGYSLTTARARLDAAGVGVSGETEVCPPGDYAGEGEARVVKLAVTAGGVHIYYARGTYRRHRDEKPKSDLLNPLV